MASNTTSPVHTQALLANHRKDLRRSGLTDETIERWGCYSIDEYPRLRSLGFGHLQVPALALPILPPDRDAPDLQDVIIKPDSPRVGNRGRPAKYEARLGSRNRIHAPRAIRNRLGDVHTPLVITEGQKKAEKAAQEGICTVSLSGVWNWRDRVGESSFPISDFDLIPLDGRELLLCFDSDAASNPHVRRAERDLAAFLAKRGARVRIKRLPAAIDGAKVGIDDFLVSHAPDEFWKLPETNPNFNPSPSDSNWPDPAPLGDELPPVQAFDLDLLPASLRPLVEDVSERMQVPPDYAAIAAMVALAGCVGRRAIIQPKAVDTSWQVVPNLWGAIIGPPGVMKSPLLRAITAPLTRIAGLWRAEYSLGLTEYQTEFELAEIAHEAWRSQAKGAIKNHQNVPNRPDGTIVAPVPRRLITTDSTFEKLHEILSQNPAGVLVVRDELTGWLSQLDKQGREGERAFYLQAWNGDTSFTLDRIGRGSIHVEAACVSLLGNIQPSRLRWYLSQSLDGGPNDDGLFQRLQLAVWPDLPATWRLVDKPPNATALNVAERVYSQLANLSADTPIHMRFEPDAQALFYEWLRELEKKVRSEVGLAPPLVAHLAKFRSLMPTLAGLFELADLVTAGDTISEEIPIGLTHTQQAAAFCEYLESHAERVYSCLVSPELRSARELVRHLQNGDLPGSFTTRDLYLKGWSGLDKPESARAALYFLQDAGWVRQADPPSTSTGGRPPEIWFVNPKVVAHAQ